MTDLIRSLREFADFLEAHPEMPEPMGAQFDAFVAPEELRRYCRIMGKVEKGSGATYFWISKKFGAIRYEINCYRRDFCIRKVVGTKIVPEHTEEIVEWECPDSILQDTGVSDES